ncbi:hypothetical protein GCM10009579_58400 [Streptomyces javensis]|uniref:Uncharacterized protein n=1 Tax=Streptomyces javensis TaxID=114698 RepID=A0ABP4HXK1_9ACTN
MTVRIHFTSDDLRRVTMAQRPAPLWEIERSLRALQSMDDLKPPLVSGHLETGT